MTIRNPIGQDVSLDLLPGKAQKRTEHPYSSITDLRHAMQAGKTGPTQQIEHKGLGIVIGIMRHCKHVKTMLRT